MAKLQTSQPLFIIMYGLPGAGKTFFARQFCERVQAAHVQAERIRHELFDQPRYDKQENDVVNQLTNYMASEFLQAGVSVVYDIDAMRLSQRRQLRDLARKSNAVPLLIWFQIDADSSFVRTSKRDRRRVDDKYSVPVDAEHFKRILVNSQNPGPAEDYVVISGKHTFNSQYNTVMKKLIDLKLLNSGEATSKFVKPGLVNLVPDNKAGRVDMSRRNIVIR